MKSIVTFYFAAVLAAAATYTVPTTGVAATLTYRVIDTEVIIDSCNWDVSGELEIPDSIEGNRVTSIGAGAFAERNGLTSVKIGNSVASIGEYAFWGCINLTMVTIGNSVTSIGTGAFHHCTSLTSVTIPDSVTSIRESAFDGCTSLTGVRIPDSVTSIAEYAFWGTGLTRVIIGNSVTSIRKATFASCINLTSVTIGNSVTSIGTGAFQHCTSLTSVTIPDNVTSIEGYAFYQCTSLTSAKIGNSVALIWGWAFYRCTSLTSVIFEGVAPTMGSSAFSSLGEGAKAIVQPVYASSFGGVGALRNGLIVEWAELQITRSGLVNAGTFFIEFKAPGLGYRVMSSPTLDFNNAVEVDPTLEPISATDNRFEFSVNGSRNFYRLEAAIQ